MSWFHSSSSSSHHHLHEVRGARSYDPYFDDVDDVKPAVTQHWRRDYAYGESGAGQQDVKPVKQPRPGGGGGGGSRVHDDQSVVLSWPVAEQFKSSLRTQESLASLRARYGIPEGFGLHLTATSQAACAPPPTPARGARGGGAGVRRGHAPAAAPLRLRLPLHPFVCDALAHFGVAPSQLAPNGWRVLVGFVVLCHFRGAGAPSLPVFRHFFALTPLPKGKGWYSFRAREGVPALFTGLPTSVKAWKEEFLLVSPPPGAPWRCPVRWGAPTKEATSDPVLPEMEAAVARRLTQGQCVVDLRSYLSESNLVAAKISRAPPSHGVEASRSVASSTAGKKKKVAAAGGGGGNGGDMLRSELQAKEKALSKAKGEINQLKKELGNAKKRELAEAQQALAYAAQVLSPEDSAKGSKRRRSAQ
ncbi:hypothetical protein BRADI_3g11353v3 [Brachypodium distachyon]|uniref:Transposase (putative) gypsy type domain-containing protein n=1 Tax=Brachypodium distachyon TaxID=15368 RepID=A0A0Q3HMH1_BRADI|nr:hypothetical protein BRADI_3g11353v3 [Brachypodium distachyon]